MTQAQAITTVFIDIGNVLLTDSLGVRVRYPTQSRTDYQECRRES